MHFLCHDTTLKKKQKQKKKTLSVDKLNLIWNRQTNFNKLNPLPRVFQIVLRGRGWKFARGDFSVGW